MLSITDAIHVGKVRAVTAVKENAPGTVPLAVEQVVEIIVVVSLLESRKTQHKGGMTNDSYG